MFSTKSQLQKRTPENGTDRESYLTLLVDEYVNSASLEAKCQVLANLSNFAYDPINYVFIREVGVLDIFLYVIRNEDDPSLLKYASAGVCNLCLDPLNAEYILLHLGLKNIIALLKFKNNEVVASAITTLYYLNNSYTNTQINTPEIIGTIQILQSSEDQIVSNVATIFLQDVCGLN